MKRRSFLKILGLGAVSVGVLHQSHALPSITVDGKREEPWPHKADDFCEFCEYGAAIRYTGMW